MGTDDLTDACVDPLSQAIDYDLTFAAARLEGVLPQRKNTISSRPISVGPDQRDQHEDGLATTWPLSSSSLRVEGRGLSNTLPKDVDLPVSDSLAGQVQWGSRCNPFSTAVPIWGQSSLFPSDLSPKRDWGQITRK